MTTAQKNENENGGKSKRDVVTTVKNQLLSDGLKGVILINGGGAVSLATWLQAVWEKPWATNLMIERQIWAISAFGFGLTFAVTAFILRFLVFYHPKTLKPKENPLWWAQIGVTSLSILSIVAAVVLITYGSLDGLKKRNIDASCEAKVDRATPVTITVPKSVGVKPVAAEKQTADSKK